MPSSIDSSKFKGLFDDLLSAVHIWKKIDDDFEFIYFNKENNKIAGGTLETMIGKKASELYPEDSPLIQNLQGVIREEKEISDEIKYEYKSSGKIRWLKVRYSFSPPNYIIAATRDITKEKISGELIIKKLKFEEALSAISSRFINLENIEEAIKLSLKDIGRLCKASRSNLYLFNETKDSFSLVYEWYSNSLQSEQDVIQEISTEEIHLLIDMLLKTKYVYVSDVSKLPEKYSKFKDNLEQFGINSFMLFPLTQKDQISGFIGIRNFELSDIGDRMEIELLRTSSEIISNALERNNYEEQLKELNASLEKKVEKRTEQLVESEKRFRLIAENMDQIIWLSDSQKRKIIYVNKAFERIWGIKRGDLYENANLWYDIIHPEDRKRVKDRIRLWFKNKGGYDIKYRILTKDDEIRYIWAKGYFIKNEQGELYRTVGIAEDITNEQLQEQTLRASRSKYQEAFERVNFFKNLIAHDMNNVLQNLNSSMELSPMYLEEPINAEKLKELCNIMKEQVIRGTRIVENVRKLSIIEENQIQLEKIDIIPILRSIVKYIEEVTETRDIDIKIQSTLKEAYIEGNELLEDVFENILNNAIKYNDAEVIEILIKLTKESNQFQIEFIDNGIGIKDSRKEALFREEFSKSSTRGGMGLGLSLVNKIMNIYEGTISVEDRIKGDYTQGSKFILRLPENA